MAESDILDDDLYDEDEDTLENRYLTFQIADEVYGIEIRYVTEKFLICLTLLKVLLTCAVR
jgi:purine-binding chemotaxis protein CheW